ncbi:MAG: DUF2634 domain-containing protein [Alicyclobacillus macrosporangiidus]|uniref:DUF2634 domain-containing protein n=1 Tax=Alicyclobacillus macrosporangiidus TaxID=392015 RepID=UPI0026F34433|nr:DUF2634 domain-containing protein [Alicyclobacillus macrosporangiidus]MCL6597932.1 DUF2634 domain-containing protein [Alicyclobacillus macrosporangiidus]
MPNLFPVFDAPDIVDTSPAAQVPTYGTSWLFDFEKGDFVTDGSGHVVTCDGYQAWAQWCAKAVLTERFRYLAYSSNYGVEMDAALQHPDPKAVQSDVERTITEALLVDPRTESVQNFTFSRSGDGQAVAFEAVPTVGTPKRVEVTLNG